MICTGIRSGTCAVKPHFTDTRLIRKPRYYGQFVWSPGKESSYIFSKFNPLNTNTPLIRPLSMAPSVSVSTGFDCTGSRYTYCACDEHFMLETACVLERFTWRHRSHIGVPKQRNGGHVGVPSNSCGSWALFLCKHFLLFQWIYIDAGHVSENALLVVMTHYSQLTLFFWRN